MLDTVAKQIEFVNFPPAACRMVNMRCLDSRLKSQPSVFTHKAALSTQAVWAPWVQRRPSEVLSVWSHNFESVWSHKTWAAWAICAHSWSAGHCVWTPCSCVNHHQWSMWAKCRWNQTIHTLGGIRKIVLLHYTKEWDKKPFWRLLWWRYKIFVRIRNQKKSPRG